MRYALYYAPSPSSLLWKIGCKWLGWDAVSKKNIEQDIFSTVDPDRINDLTRIPRHYGLHATLKPPFNLATGCSEGELTFAINFFFTQYQPFYTSPLVLRQINDFFCLCPEKQTFQVDSLAATCVQKFDSFRSPPSRLELARRRAEILTVSQKQNLAKWGYPYVLNEYRFHITLTSRIVDAAEKMHLHSLLTDIFAPVLGKPLLVEAVCLFVEPAIGQAFYCLERFPFKHLEQNTKEIISLPKTVVLETHVKN